MERKRSWSRKQNTIGVDLIRWLREGLTIRFRRLSNDALFIRLTERTVDTCFKDSLVDFSRGEFPFSRYNSAESHKEIVRRIQSPETVPWQHWPHFLDKERSFASSLSPGCRIPPWNPPENFGTTVSEARPSIIRFYGHRTFDDGSWLMLAPLSVSCGQRRNFVLRVTYTSFLY